MIRTLTIKTRTCADDFRHLSREWRRLTRPRGKQAKRARFAHEARQRRRAAAVVRRYGAVPGFIGAVTHIRVNAPGGQVASFGDLAAMFLAPWPSADMNSMCIPYATPGEAHVAGADKKHGHTGTASA